MQRGCIGGHVWGTFSVANGGRNRQRCQIGARRCVFYNGIRQAVIPQVHRSQDQLKHAPPRQLSSRPFELRAFASSAATSRRRATQANQGSEGQHKNAPWPLDSWPMIQHRGPRRWVCSAETKGLMSRRERTALDVLVGARLAPARCGRSRERLATQPGRRAPA